MKDISLNFGVIKESILRLKTRNFINNERLGIDSFIKTLNENSILKKQSLIFKAFDTNQQFKKERLAERFINQTLEIINGVKWDSLINENRTIRITYLDSTHVGSAVPEKEVYYNHIHNLIEAKCKGQGNYDIEKEQISYEYVIEHLMSEKENSQIIESSDEPNLSWEYVTKLAINNFNERYAHLNESELKIVKILTSNNSIKINHLKDLKQETLSIINKLKNNSNEDNSIFETFEIKLNNINPDTIENIDDAIISCFELNENLKNIK